MGNFGYFTLLGRKRGLIEPQRTACHAADSNLELLLRSWVCSSVGPTNKFSSWKETGLNTVPYNQIITIIYNKSRKISINTILNKSKKKWKKKTTQNVKGEINKNFRIGFFSSIFGEFFRSD